MDSLSNLFVRSTRQIYKKSDLGHHYILNQVEIN